MAPVKESQFSKKSKDDKRVSIPRDNKMSLSSTKKVVLETIEPSKASRTLTHLSLYERMQLELQRTMELRNHFKIIENFNNEPINLTPKPINISYETEAYEKLTKKFPNLRPMDDDETESFRSTNSSIMRARSSRGVGFSLSLDDVINGIVSERAPCDILRDITSRHSLNMVDLDSSTSSSISTIPQIDKRKKQLPFIRIILRKTELLLLYEQRSMTATKYTVDGNLAEVDNKQYDYLTMGRGKTRRRTEAETQTFATLYKSREINTIPVKTMDTGCYVSYFEMFDTYKTLSQCDGDGDGSDNKKLYISQSKTLEEQFAIIAQLPSFHLASVITKRTLAGNVFEQGQRRFRNMSGINRMVDKIDFKYSINKLFTINPYAKDNIRKAVADMSFCYANSDILAVAYGIFSYQAAELPKTGEVCVWSIKNPCDPERYYHYNVPVICVEFSPYIPSLLAIGLYDGSVEVQDIAKYNQPPVAISQRSSSPEVSPVLAIKWFQQLSLHGQQNDIDPFLTLSQDGSVTQYRIINSPFLVGSKQIVLERIEGMPEGLPVKYSSKLTLTANRCPQGLNLTKHPVQPDIYYVLTDEGCVYKCSTNYQHHYLEVLKTHEGAVNCMDFSPWSPKLFLTCGNDWHIRIWLDGIFEPLIILKNLYGPYQWAGWSRTHSTVIIAINRKQCEVWDLRYNILRPMSTTLMETSYNTIGSFSRDGYSLAVGNERGKVFINALDDMPFPPHYQYDLLEKAIFKVISYNPNLVLALKSAGYFGYPDKCCVIPA